MKKAWTALRGHGLLVASIAVALAGLAVGGISMALAADGGEERSERDTFVPGPFEHVAPAPELEAEAEEFHECMSAEGFEPPEPSERPGIAEAPAPEGLDAAFEKCRDLLPEGLPPGPPAIGPGPRHAIECKAPPIEPATERDANSPGDPEESAE